MCILNHVLAKTVQLHPACVMCSLCSWHMICSVTVLWNEPWTGGAWLQRPLTSNIWRVIGGVSNLPFLALLWLTKFVISSIGSYSPFVTSKILQLISDIPLILFFAGLCTTYLSATCLLHCKISRYIYMCLERYLVNQFKCSSHCTVSILWNGDHFCTISWLDYNFWAFDLIARLGWKLGEFVALVVWVGGSIIGQRYWSRLAPGILAAYFQLQTLHGSLNSHGITSLRWMPGEILGHEWWQHYKLWSARSSSLCWWCQSCCACSLTACLGFPSMGSSSSCGTWEPG